MWGRMERVGIAAEGISAGLVLFGVVALAGCAAGGETLAMCSRGADCVGLERCINGFCVPPGVDAGNEDAPPARDAGNEDAPGPADAGTDAPAADAPGTDAGTDAFVGVDAGPCGGPCRFYRFASGATAWTATALPGGAFAPDTPIRAAFDLESLAVAYALTDATYHVLDLSAMRWTGGGARNDLFPEASGTPLIAAISIPEAHVGGTPGQEGLVISGVAVAYTGRISLTTREAVLDGQVTDFGDAWRAPLAPSRSDILAEWLDLDNADGWAVGSPRDLCGAAATSIGPYTADLTSTHVHLNDAGSCFEFFERAAYSSFTPFARPGAPPAASVQAAFYNQGALYVFTD